MAVIARIGSRIAADTSRRCDKRAGLHTALRFTSPERKSRDVHAVFAEGCSKTPPEYGQVLGSNGPPQKPLPSFSWLIETGKVCALNFPIGMNPG